MEDDTWPPEYPHRGWETDEGRTEAHEALIKSLLDKLARLELETRPSGGADTANRKDLKAFQALHTAMWLVDVVAGWAIDHQIGLAKEGLEFVPIQPSANKQHPDYLALLAAVDSHEHERSGSTYRAEEWPDDPRFKRRALINLLHPMNHGASSRIFGPAEEALRALDFGEVDPMLQEQRDRRKAGYRALLLQLKAIGFIEFHVAAGMRKGPAQTMVASAYGLSPDAIRNWESRLRAPESGIGALKVSRQIVWARNAASFVVAARNGKSEHADTAASHLKTYSSEAIKKAGDAYKASGAG